jgi:DNA-binding transcriptional LysR family regulator
VLAEELHFARAARRLGITQQAMSKRIARLEAVTGAALVDRSDRRNVRLTAHGTRLADAAYEVLVAVGRLPVLTDTAPGRLRIDVMDDNLAPMGWVRRAARSTSAPPIDVVRRPHDQALDALLHTGRAHVAFGRAGAVSTPWPPDLRRRLVLLEPLSLLIPPTHPWAHLDHIALPDLRGQSWWFPMTDAPYEWRDFVAELSRHARVTLDTTGSTFGYEQWVADVTAGLAPPSLLGEEMQPPPGVALTTVPIVDPTPVYPWSVLWHRTTPADTVDHLLTLIGLNATPSPAAADVWLPIADATLHRTAG